ncbi:unnamed protein product [Prunus armeniaca]
MINASYCILPIRGTSSWSSDEKFMDYATPSTTSSALLFLYDKGSAFFAGVVISMGGIFVGKPILSLGLFGASGGAMVKYSYIGIYRAILIFILPAKMPMLISSGKLQL